MRAWLMVLYSVATYVLFLATFTWATAWCGIRCTWDC
jgi:hypothetical protein